MNAATTISPICAAIGRAIDDRHARKKDLATFLDWDPSTITRLLDGREPDLDTIGRIENYFGMPRGKLLVDAGYVHVPGTAEDMLRIDTRLTELHRQMAVAQVEMCVESSALAKRREAASNEVAAVNATAADSRASLMVATS